MRMGDPVPGNTRPLISLSYNADQTLGVTECSEKQDDADKAAFKQHADGNQDEAFPAKICFKLARWRRDNWCINLWVVQAVLNLSDIASLSLRPNTPQSLHSDLRPDLTQKHVLHATY